MFVPKGSKKFLLETGGSFLIEFFCVTVILYIVEWTHSKTIRGSQNYYWLRTWSVPSVNISVVMKYYLKIKSCSLFSVLVFVAMSCTDYRYHVDQKRFYSGKIYCFHLCTISRAFFGSGISESRIGFRHLYQNGKMYKVLLAV